MNEKPSISEVVTNYLPLRRAGKELTACCPFHADKHPSFFVNEEKGLFHCFGCQASGDVFDFVMKLNGFSFREALADLGMDTARPRPDDRRRQAARKVIRWVNLQRERLNERIHELDEQMELADELGDDELAESFWRERGIICDMRDDLARAEYLPDFIELKEVIERIAGGDLC
jgi:DNA primase